MINPEIDKMLIVKYPSTYDSLYSFKLPFITIDANPGVTLPSKFKAKLTIQQKYLRIESDLIEQRGYNTVLTSVSKYNSCVTFIIFKLDQQINSDTPLLKSMIKRLKDKKVTSTLLTNILQKYGTTIDVEIQEFSKLILNHYKIYYPKDNSKTPKKKEIQNELKEINDCVVVQWDINYNGPIGKRKFQLDTKEEFNWIDFFKSKEKKIEYINSSKFNNDLNIEFKQGINILLDSNTLYKEISRNDKDVYYLNDIPFDSNYNIEEWVKFDNKQIVIKKEKKFNTDSNFIYFNSLQFLHVIKGFNNAYLIEHINGELICSIVELNSMRPEDWINVSQI